MLLIGSFLDALCQKLLKATCKEYSVFQASINDIQKKKVQLLFVPIS